ncbi:hypothetical protein FRX31_029153 [Thalictrum thalictroides]|uniref:Uncharacterized protein n=1 Tax=Thalictrum thalictroides TaxID=46969 RepID=A0A7J6VAL1_THATH|nr:hypothetical protein FRX31_029153 [Thalictrum thalictroides]
MKSSKFSIFTVKLDHRPTRHGFWILLNSDTKIQEVDEIHDFPTMKPFSFIKLNTLQEHQSNTFLNDVVGLYRNSTQLKEVKGGKVNRDIWIQDETAIVKVTLWGEMAKNFIAPTNLSNKPVFVVSSTVVNYFDQTKEYSINAKPLSNYYFDLDIPEVEFLKNSEIDMNKEFNDWTTKNRKTISEIIESYNANSQSEDIKSLIVQSFEEMYKSSDNVVNQQLMSLTPTLVIEQQNVDLVKLPNMEEVKTAVFSMNPKSSPGPDRFNDLNQDGRISGVEAASFFQGANLPKNVQYDIGN